MSKSTRRAALRKQRQAKRKAEIRALGIGVWMEHTTACKQYVIFGKRPLESYIRQHGSL